MKTLAGMDFSDPVYVKVTLVRMVGFFVAYVLLFKLLRRKVGISSEYNCRIVTFIHGLISCYAALHFIVLPSIGSYKGESFIICDITPRFF